MIVPRGKRNLRYYPYRENFRYTLQRWTGVIAFAFILWHVFHTRGWFPSEWWTAHVTRPLGGGTFDRRTRRGHRRRGHPGLAAGRQIAYVVGSPGQRLSPGQRPVDDGHHLGRLDQPQAQRWANVPCACWRRRWRRPDWRRWWE